MAETTASMDLAPARKSGVTNALNTLFLSSESIRGYTLLSPTLIIMAIGMIIYHIDALPGIISLIFSLIWPTRSRPFASLMSCANPTSRS